MIDFELEIGTLTDVGTASEQNEDFCGSFMASEDCAVAAVAEAVYFVEKNPDKAKAIIAAATAGKSLEDAAKEVLGNADGVIKLSFGKKQHVLIKPQ